MSTQISEILKLSRQSEPLSNWFRAELERAVETGEMLEQSRLGVLRDKIVTDLRAYSAQTGVSTAVIGMSGGVDSALTAALLKAAGWRVVGYTLPIEQNPDETHRGRAACEALSLEHVNVDLTAEFHNLAARLADVDVGLADTLNEAVRIRRGNMRARLRMMTLYDQAHRFGGVVASTDNFSELAAGFWTLHGDVGDIAPIQSLLKSWEVSWMARDCGVPESIWTATPTDGLGISNGDEAQLGVSYLEWDLMVLALVRLGDDLTKDLAGLADLLRLGGDERAMTALHAVAGRMGRTWFKRINPICLKHAYFDRYAQLASVDRALFWPTLLAD